MKTLEEFFIEKYQKLEEKNKVLEERQEKLLEMKNILIDERDEYKNRFIEFISRLKEDFGIESKKDCNGKPFIKAEKNYIWSEWQEEQYNYYKNIFNFKEEGEE